MRTLAALLVALVLAGCATLQNPLTRSRLAEIESAYALALSAANGYRKLYLVNRCTAAKPLSATNYCAQRSVVVRLQQADARVQTALKAARQFITNNPTLDASAFIDAIALAVAAFQQVEITYGVH